VKVPKLKQRKSRRRKSTKTDSGKYKQMATEEAEENVEITSPALEFPTPTRPNVTKLVPLQHKTATLPRAVQRPLDLALAQPTVDTAPPEAAVEPPKSQPGPGAGVGSTTGTLLSKYSEQAAKVRTKMRQLLWGHVKGRTRPRKQQRGRLGPRPSAQPITPGE
jgi:hypothetical protein